MVLYFPMSAIGPNLLRSLEEGQRAVWDPTRCTPKYPEDERAE